VATPAARNILRVPGRLCVAPTDLTADFPHGGTALGVTRDMEFRFGYRTSIATAEEWGGVPNRIFYEGETCLLGAVLRDYDGDMIKRIFPNTATASQTNDVTINNEIDAGNRAGYDLSGLAIKVLFSPLAVDRHQFILLYNAIPVVEETSLFNLSMADEIGLTVLFYGTPDTNGKVYQIGLRDNMSLS